MSLCLYTLYRSLSRKEMCCYWHSLLLPMPLSPLSHRNIYRGECQKTRMANTVCFEPFLTPLLSHIVLSSTILWKWLTSYSAGFQNNLPFLPLPASPVRNTAVFKYHVWYWVSFMIPLSFSSSSPLFSLYVLLCAMALRGISSREPDVSKRALTSSLWLITIPTLDPLKEKQTNLWIS